MSPETVYLRWGLKVDHLHRLGPRALLEMLGEFVDGDENLAADLDFILAKYNRITPAMVEALDGRVIRLPLATVEGGRQ